jgi:serine/threonine protein kinase/CheY-like chemotaxis protein
VQILAADDDEAMARLLEHCARRWGYDPIIAHDGKEAWRILKRADAPRVVVLDWDMPGLSGLEVCRLLRSTPHGTGAYVLMLTARQQKEDLIEALESGADDFLSKPFHPRELQLRLAKGIRDAARDATAKIVEAPSTPPSRGLSGTPPTGTTLAGKYRLEKRIAEGGMSSVWLGVHLALGINVAIKFMAPDLAETADYASFEKEARAAAQLRNEHIVRVYDHGLTSTGLPYLVMEFLSGQSLAERVWRRGPLELDEVCTIVTQSASALSDAHARGIVHRDVKPENIVIVDDIERPNRLSVTLIDFGLAKRWRMEAAIEGTVAGTPSYMSPEYLRGDTPPTPHLDLWGLAATAFVAITGKLPFPGETLREVYQRVCVGEAPVPSILRPSVPAGVDAWFAKACARDPAARFGTAEDLAAALVVACSVVVDPPAKQAAEKPPAVDGAAPVSFAKTEPSAASGAEIGKSRKQE